MISKPICLRVKEPFACFTRPKFSTKALNQAVKRNGTRFPADFMFRLTPEETAQLNRSQFVTGSQRHRDPRFPSRAFTRGRRFHTPWLAWIEFVPDYVGPFRDGTAPCATENHVIWAFLEMIFHEPPLLLGD